MPVKILIVDDSAVVRHSLRSYIEQKSDWSVCGEAENGEIAIAKVKELQPEVVILDFAMPVMDGLEAARHISRIAPHVAMLMFTLQDCTQIEDEAKSRGIRAVLSKSSTGPDHLISAITDIIDSKKPPPAHDGEAA